jgi:hypothetical protein
MTPLLKILPLFAALAAAPAFAAEPDPHAGHHPAADAAAPKGPAPTAAAKPEMKGCPMMDAKMAGGPSAMGGKTPDGKMMDGKMMMDGKDMHCMAGAAAEKGADAAHDHDHPAAPK